MKQQPRKNLAESVLARAELYRRGMMFEGVPQMATAQLELPDAGADGAAALNPADATGAASPAVPAAGGPGVTAQLVAGAVEGQSPLQTMVAGA